MNKVLIVTHSILAEGFYKSIDFLSGMTDNLSFIDAYVDDSDWTKKAKKFLEDNCTSENNVVVLTDLFGGSVNQKMTLMLNDYKFTLITGVNLPLALSLALQTEPLTKDKCQQLISEARQQLKIVENQTTTSDESNDDFLS